MSEKSPAGILTGGYVPIQIRSGIDKLVLAVLHLSPTKTLLTHLPGTFLEVAINTPLNPAPIQFLKTGRVTLTETACSPLLFNIDF